MPSEHELVPPDLLKLAVEDIQQRSPGVLRGWVEVQATVDAQAYEALRQDPNIYIVDVSGPAIAAAFQDDPAAHTMPVEV